MTTIRARKGRSDHGPPDAAPAARAAGWRRPRNPDQKRQKQRAHRETGRVHDHSHPVAARSGPAEQGRGRQAAQPETGRAHHGRHRERPVPGHVACDVSDQGEQRAVEQLLSCGQQDRRDRHHDRAPGHQIGHRPQRLQQLGADHDRAAARPGPPAGPRRAAPPVPPPCPGRPPSPRRPAAVPRPGSRTAAPPAGTDRTRSCRPPAPPARPPGCVAWPRPYEAGGAAGACFVSRVPRWAGRNFLRAGPSARRSCRCARGAGYRRGARGCGPAPSGRRRRGWRRCQR